MQTKWTTDKERVAAHMKIPPQKKLEWLREMNEFNAKYFDKRQKRIHLALRMNRSKNFV